MQLNCCNGQPCFPSVQMETPVTGVTVSTFNLATKQDTLGHTSETQAVTKELHR